MTFLPFNQSPALLQPTTADSVPVPVGKEGLEQACSSNWKKVNARADVVDGHVGSVE